MALALDALSKLMQPLHALQVWTLLISGCSCYTEKKKAVSDGCDHWTMPPINARTT